jgi:hypothetical protein
MSSAITKTLSRVVYSCHISPQPIYFACEYEHRRPSNRYHSIAKQNKKRETFAALNVSPAGSWSIFLFSLVKSLPQRVDLEDQQRSMRFGDIGDWIGKQL